VPPSTFAAIPVVFDRPPACTDGARRRLPCACS
jgi:hypothetical protein